MAIPWLVVLQSVPWADVISNAPKVADGARKLWTMVSRQPASDPADGPAGSGAPLSPAALEQRIVGLETKLADLDAQMVASAELIKALAEQNAQLIKRVDDNRGRLLWLGVATLAAFIAAIVALLVGA